MDTFSAEQGEVRKSHCGACPFDLIVERSGNAVVFSELFPEERIGVGFEFRVTEEFIAFKDVVEVLYGCLDAILGCRARDLFLLSFQIAAL